MTVRLKRKYLGNETRYLQVKSMMLTDAGSNESLCPYGKLFEILTILLANENFLRS